MAGGPDVEQALPRLFDKDKLPRLRGLRQVPHPGGLVTASMEEDGMPCSPRYSLKQRPTPDLGDLASIHVSESDSVRIEPCEIRRFSLRWNGAARRTSEFFVRWVKRAHDLRPIPVKSSRPSRDHRIPGGCWASRPPMRRKGTASRQARSPLGPSSVGSLDQAQGVGSSRPHSGTESMRRRAGRAGWARSTAGGARMFERTGRDGARSHGSGRACSWREPGRGWRSSCLRLAALLAASIAPMSRPDLATGPRLSGPPRRVRPPAAGKPRRSPSPPSNPDVGATVAKGQVPHPGNHAHFHATRPGRIRPRLHRDHEVFQLFDDLVPLGDVSDRAVGHLKAGTRRQDPPAGPGFVSWE